MKTPCEKCGTTNGIIGWVNDPRGEAYGYLKECNSGVHDQDRDPYQHGGADEVSR